MCRPAIVSLKRHGLGHSWHRGGLRDLIVHWLGYLHVEVGLCLHLPPFASLIASKSTFRVSVSSGADPPSVSFKSEIDPIQDSDDVEATPPLPSPATADILFHKQGIIKAQAKMWRRRKRKKRKKNG